MHVARKSKRELTRGGENERQCWQSCCCPKEIACDTPHSQWVSKLGGRPWAKSERPSCGLGRPSCAQFHRPGGVVLQNSSDWGRCWQRCDEGHHGGRWRQLDPLMRQLWRLLQTCDPVGSTGDQKNATQNPDQIRDPPKHALEHQFLSLSFCSSGGSLALAYRAKARHRSARTHASRPLP